MMADTVASPNGLVLSGDPAISVRAYPIAARFFNAGLRSLVIVPLVSQDETIGALALWSSGTDVYTDRDLLLAERVGAQIAGAIATAQLYAELQRTGATMRSIVDGAVDGIITVDQEGLIESFNPSAQRMFGYYRGEVSGRNIDMLIPEHEGGAGLNGADEFQPADKPGTVGVIKEVVGRRRDGSTFPVELSVSEARVDQKRFTCVVRDISERRRVDRALRESEERFRLLVENAGDAFFLHDVSGKIIDVNQRACDSLGYSRTELLGLSMSDIEVEPDQGANQGPLDGQSTGVTVTPGGVHRRKDGDTFPVEVRLASFDWRGRPLYLALARDITTRKGLERQLIEAQKMEAVGRLAGGIAHDFNNLLTGIQGYCHLGRMKLGDAEQLESYIGRIDWAAERASDLTRQLLAFSRRQIFEPRVINLNGMIGQMDQMLRGLITENIEVVVEADAELGLVKVDPGQMEQVLINLAVNARDVMTEGGVLTVRTSGVTLDDAYRRRHPEIPLGEYVTLSVSDTGTGISEEIKDHIFEPFFTTKDIGKGTGLGLSACYGIVAQNGGHITVDSEPGKGATFTVILPRVDEELTPEVPPSNVDDIPFGFETVLVVEDEPLVLRVAEQVLSDQGYNVLSASNGQEAMAVGREHYGERIHLLLTDVIMPQMGGKELVGRFLEIHPESKVLYTSGHRDDVILERGVLSPEISLMQKPFTPASLAQQVRRVLDSAVPTVSV